MWRRWWRLLTQKFDPIVIARRNDVAIPDCTERIACLLNRLVSLIAAKAYFFCLDTKETKNQDNKDASTRPADSLRFFRCSGTSYLHITQKTKPSFPPLRWPALVVRALRFFFSPLLPLPVSRTASGEIRQNNGGLVSNGRA
ncbi:hypothetical protein SAMN05216490_1106 [Mucilaginibacter mallensis]|uniref:Uncharacterized protein n=1 Tax=Mucilaginibacter mallensis TaxID=652787 RepID=A0A1H1RZF0_MUCMA|nr:hypothetical protein SAMN05216490_1106 [Mucilaginibacter mallensis]